MSEESPYVAGRLEAGLALLATSFVLGLVGLGLFLFADSRDGMAVYRWREAALVVAAPALAGFVWSLTVALPTRRVLRWTAHLAFVLCLVATVLFAVHYPNNFNVPDGAQTDYLPLDLGLYVLGLAVILAASVTSVLSHYIRFAPPLPEPIPTKKYEVPDWVVERDVEDAMKRHAMSWGLDQPEGEESVHLPELPAGAQVNAGTAGTGRRIELDGSILEHARTALVETRPLLHSRREAPAEWADDSAEALAALQKARRANPKAYRMRTGFWATLLGLRSNPPPVGGSAHVAPSDTEPAAQAEPGPAPSPESAPDQTGDTAEAPPTETPLVQVRRRNPRAVRARSAPEDATDAPAPEPTAGGEAEEPIQATDAEPATAGGARRRKGGRKAAQE